MAPRNGVKALAFGAVGAALLKQCTFVPPAPQASHSPASVAAAVGAATLGAYPALALNEVAIKNIGDASKKLTEEVYPFFKEVDWNSYLYLAKPGGSAGALEWLKAIDKLIVMGEKMDGKLLAAAAKAHHSAILSIDKDGVLSKSALTEVDGAIGKLIASVDEPTTMDVYNTFSGLIGSDVPAYLMSTVKEADAKKAYEGFLYFKDIVKANRIRAEEVAANPSLLPQKLDDIEEAATKLSKAAYPFIKDVDWTSDLFTKPLPGLSTKQALELTDKLIVMGSEMDPKLLKLAALAHHNAIQSVDAKGVTSEADFEKVNSALGKLIASVPKSTVMDVYNAFAKSVNPVVGNYNFDLFNKGADAIAAHKALLEFKDTVKAAQEVLKVMPVIEKVNTGAR